MFGNKLGVQGVQVVPRYLCSMLTHAEPGWCQLQQMLAATGCRLHVCGPVSIRTLSEAAVRAHAPNDARCEQRSMMPDSAPTCQPVMMPSASSRPPQPDNVPRIKAGATLSGYSCTARFTCMCRKHGQAAARQRVAQHSDSTAGQCHSQQQLQLEAEPDHTLACCCVW